MFDTLIINFPVILERWLSGLTTDFARYFFAAAGVSLLLLIFMRKVESRRIQIRRATVRDSVREFMNSAATVVVFSFNTFWVFLLENAGLFNLPDTGLNVWLFIGSLTMIMVMHDAYFYWLHRWLHTRRMFRIAHATHHKSRTPTPWAAYSFAPIEAFFEGIFVPLYILLVPIHIEVVVVFLIHQIIRNTLGHSGFEYGWPGFSRSRWTGWLTTTTHHDLHHSEGRHNFGLYFTWWDRLMGTENPQYHASYEAAAKPWAIRKTASAIFTIGFTMATIMLTSLTVTGSLV
jgi:Delta7-sterol 5-desaturase